MAAAPTVAALALGVGLLVGCGDSTSGPANTSEAAPAAELRGPEPQVRLPQGEPPKRLIVRRLRRGDGEQAQAGDELTTQFVAVRFTGERFESSWERGREPFSFRLGREESSPRTRLST